jgi:transcriptional/translational regulatory protein YebC/TACO1
MPLVKMMLNAKQQNIVFKRIERAFAKGERINGEKKNLEEIKPENLFTGCPSDKMYEVKVKFP